MNIIPLVDLSRQFNLLKEDIFAETTKIFKKSNFILGIEVTEFESSFAKYCECKHAIGVASGTDALFLALKAAGIGHNDYVITPSNTFIATALAISFTGAIPFFTDVDEDTFNITGQILESAINKAQKLNINCKAVIPVHLYGQPCPMDEIVTVAQKYNITIIEDACQAHGATFQRKTSYLPAQKIGGFGLAGCFSFFPGKNLGAFGDGGAIVTNNDEVADTIKLLRNYGSTEKYIHKIKGHNSRLDTLQAAILNVKLAYLDKWNEQRNKIAFTYREAIKSSNSLKEKILLPEESQNKFHVYHLFVIRLKGRDKMLSHLHSKGIMAGIHYPIPIHLQQAYKELNLKQGTFPIAERLATEILSLPIFPGMKIDEIERVVDEMKNFYN